MFFNVVLTSIRNEPRLNPPPPSRRYVIVTADINNIVWLKVEDGQKWKLAFWYQISQFSGDFLEIL